MELGLKNKRAIVTGASRGIGRAIAEALAAEGCHVAICARGEEGVSAAVDALRASGVQAYGEALDVRDSAAVQRWYDSSVEALGGMDIVISNVATQSGNQGEQMWLDSFESDLLQHVRLIEMALPELKKSDCGSVVAIASIASVLTRVPPGEKAYGPMKAALITMLGQLASTYGPEGIRFNSVSPGPIDFPGGFWDKVKQHDDALYKRAAGLSVLGRLGTPEEIAKAVTYLSSPAAAYITGTNLRIDGGTVKAVNF